MVFVYSNCWDCLQHFKISSEDLNNRPEEISMDDLGNYDYEVRGVMVAIPYVNELCYNHSGKIKGKIAIL